MAVYWVGTDGNVWYKGDNGVENLGSSTGAADKGGNWNLSDGGFESGTLRQSVQAQRIADPNPSSQSSPAPAASSTGQGAASTAWPDKSNDIALQNAGLSAVDTQLGTGLSSIDKTLATIMGRYDEDATNSDARYTESSNTNVGNLQKNKQSAMVNAAQGRQGLFGSLASIGALNGSAIDLANNAVTKGANDDLSGAQDAYEGNQTSLDEGINAFRTENERRKEDASINAENARQGVRNEAAKSRFQIFGNLANNYAEMGNEGEAKRYTGMASSLYPEISSTSIPQANLAYSGVGYTPAELSNYLAGEGSTVVQTTPTAPGQFVPGLVAAPTKKKQLQTA